MSFTIESNEPLLSEALNQKYNPLLLQIVGVREMPELPIDTLYDPLWAEMKFFDLDAFDTEVPPLTKE